MIEWKKYDPYDRGIESHVTHLIINIYGVPQLAQHASLINDIGYGWHDHSGYRISNVTHYAEINLPE